MKRLLFAVLSGLAISSASAPAALAEIVFVRPQPHHDVRLDDREVREQHFVRRSRRGRFSRRRRFHGRRRFVNRRRFHRRSRRFNRYHR